MKKKNIPIKEQKNKKEVYFERALFFSWYCKYGDCKFCLMSVNKGKNNSENKRADNINKEISNNNQKESIKKGIRSLKSLFAEAIIAKHLNWNIEFLSGGYDSYSKDKILFMIKGINSIYKKKIWINIGTLTKQDLKKFAPFIEGYAGTIETVNWKLREYLCPSKKLRPILKTFRNCDELGLKKAITIIIGVGETIKDFENLKKFINKYKISRITFYALNPHKGTIFTKSPDKEYYTKWISMTRKTFPDIYIIAGAWSDKVDYYVSLLNAGADAITKIPAIKKFGSEELKKIEKEINASGRKLKSNLTKIPKINWDKEVDKLDSNIFDSKLKEEIKNKIKDYITEMKKNIE